MTIRQLIVCMFSLCLVIGVLHCSGWRSGAGNYVDNQAQHSQPAIMLPVHLGRVQPVQAWELTGHTHVYQDTMSGPQRFIAPYVRPGLASRMADLRPIILAAAARHNDPEQSGMSDREFAVIIALILYNEHHGWLEDDITLLRALRPWYEQAQVRVNRQGIGANFSVWPTNLRPSVALEILRHEVPVPEPTRLITVPIEVYGSQIVLDDYDSQQALLAAITDEITHDELAIEYLAANLRRGVYRARYEGVPVSWWVLAAWHNQGIVQPMQICTNSMAATYVQRAAAYMPLARRLIAQEGALRLAHSSREYQGQAPQ